MTHLLDADALELTPPRPFQLNLRPPGSKSITNRALLFAAIARGRSRLQGCLDSDDTRLMRTCLHRIESKSALRLHLKEGERRALLPGGTGKTLLAFSDSEDPGLAPTLAQIRKDHFVINIGEREPEIASVSAPVLRNRGELIGAISLTGPSVKFSNGRAHHFLSFLLPAAAELTRLSGGDPAPFHKSLQHIQTSASA